MRYTTVVATFALLLLAPAPAGCAAGVRPPFPQKVSFDGQNVGCPVSLPLSAS